MKKVLCSAIAALSTVVLATESSADTWDKAKERGSFVVAIDPTFPPYEYTDSTGKVIGYDPAVLRRVAEGLGLKVEFQKMAFVGVIPGLIAGSFDFTSTALNATPERAQKIAFTTPVSKTVNAVLKLAENERVGADFPKSLSGLTAAVKMTTQPERYLKSVNEELAKAGLAEIKILSVETVEQALAALKAKRADFVVDDLSVIGMVMRDRGEGLKIVGEIGSTEFICWGLRKSDPELLAKINEQIIALKKSGELKKLQEEHLGVSFDLPDEVTF